VVLRLKIAVLGAATLFGSVAFACGDKLLVIGRGVRFQRAYATHQSDLLIYFSGIRSGAALESGKLQSTLKQAGHRVRSVDGASQLDEVLKSEKVDVVLVDFADLTAITQELHSAPSKPVVIPILFRPSKAELATAQKEYRFALKAPADAVQFLMAIDEAMKSRLKIGGKI
jgi:hypothetical protein